MSGNNELEKLLLLLQKNHFDKPAPPCTPSALHFGRTASKGVSLQVLKEIIRLCEERPIIFETVKRLYSEQIKKEEELMAYRRQVTDKHEKLKQELFAKEIIQASSRKEESNVEMKTFKDLEKVDQHIYKELDLLLKHQQREMEQLGVPLMYETEYQEEIATQRKILDLIWEMAENE